jgi:hypothetical protein
MPVGGQLRTDRTTGKHADHKITNAALGLPRLRPFSLANETPEARAIGAHGQAATAVGSKCEILRSSSSGLELPQKRT